MNAILSMLSFAGIIIGIPVATIWGWLRWLRKSDLKHFFSAVSFLAFACASIAELLAVSSVFFVLQAHLTPYDHRWYRLLFTGLLTSALAVLLSLIGIWQRSALRWRAPLCASGMLFVWFVLAEAD